MGTKIGANNVHFAEAEPTKVFMMAVKKIIPITVTTFGMEIAFKSDAPFKARRLPNLNYQMHQ